jgi:hypothetical protein
VISLGGVQCGWRLISSVDEEWHRDRGWIERGVVRGAKRRGGRARGGGVLIPRESPFTAGLGLVWAALCNAEEADGLSQRNDSG